MRLLRLRGEVLDVVLIDHRRRVGGMTSSFFVEGLIFDQGSHRLHPVIAPDILSDIRDLIGDDLLERPRRGRIRLMNRFVSFPLAAADSLRHLPVSFLLGVAADMLRMRFQHRGTPVRSFDEELLHSLGPTICESFYFPYSEKLWGLRPQQLSADQARRRVSQRAIVPLIRKVLRAGPGAQKAASGSYYYPRKGYGQICQSLAAEVRRLGGTFLLSTRPTVIRNLVDGGFL